MKIIINLVIETIWYGAVVICGRELFLKCYLGVINK
jgi:hypothetical protein